MFVDPETMAIIALQGHDFTEEQKQWFIQYCVFRINYLYQNNKNWTNKLKGKKANTFCMAFVEHWLEGYKKNPVQYQKEHQ